MELPKGAISIDNRYGMRYPKDEGYYGFIVKEHFSGHIWSERQYTIDVYNGGEYVTTFTAPHGDW